MKKVMIALLLLGATAMTREATAQISVNINIGSQPAWGPTGYDYAGYYYLPDINCYYDIGRGQFMDPNGSRWVYARSLPGRYRNVNLYNTYKVVINRPSPFRNNRDDINRYARYKGVHSQPVIRDSRDSRYYASKGHPMHQQWEKDHGRVDAGPRGDRGNRGNHYGRR